MLNSGLWLHEEHNESASESCCEDCQTLTVICLPNFRTTGCVLIATGTRKVEAHNSSKCATQKTTFIKPCRKVAESTNSYPITFLLTLWKISYHLNFNCQQINEYKYHLENRTIDYILYKCACNCVWLFRPNAETFVPWPTCTPSRWNMIYVYIYMYQMQSKLCSHPRSREVCLAGIKRWLYHSCSLFRNCMLSVLGDVWMRRFGPAWRSGGNKRGIGAKSDRKCAHTPGANVHVSQIYL